MLLAPACAPIEANRGDSQPSQKLYQAPPGPVFVAAPAGDEAASAVAETAGAAVRFARSVSPNDRGVRPLEAVAAPILYGAPEGREFLTTAGPRAFSIGAPPAECPARSYGAGPTFPAATRASLEGCFARLRAARRDGRGDCGCLVVAIGDMIIAPPETLAYASGVSARVIAPDFGEERYLVAEELAGANGDRLLAFRAAGAPSTGPMVASVAPDGAAEVLWRDAEDVAFSGRRISDGLRRGRYAERLYVEDDAGRRLIVLIGYEPVEYAVKRQELTTWPQG